MPEDYDASPWFASGTDRTLSGRMELFEAKWTEVPSVVDAVNVEFVRNVVGKSRVASAGIICRSPNSFPITDGIRALPVTELGS